VCIVYRNKHQTKSFCRALNLFDSRYTGDYEESSIKGTSHLKPGSRDEDHAEVVASNPILSFRMLSRYAEEFKAVGQHISENAEQGNKLALIWFPVHSIGLTFIVAVFNSKNSSKVESTYVLTLEP